MRYKIIPLALLLSIGAAAQDYGHLPLYFEQNRGQTDARAQYIARAQNLTAFITKDGLTLSSGQQSLSVRIAGANPKTQFTADTQIEGVSNYYLGTRIIEAVPHYAQVRANSIRKGVDLVYHGSARDLEYDFILHPGARPTDIRLQFEGASPKMDENGDLVLKLGTAELRQRNPKVWQGEGTERSEIDCHYVLTGKNTVRLALGPYSQNKDLVIDPILSYSTFLGGTGSDAATGIAVDSSGDAYVTGYTNSVDFPVTSGAFHGTNNTDAFVTCLNPGGTGLVYSTYVGGSSPDQSNGIAINAGNAYITGFSNSSDFPITLGQSHTGAFLVKLTASGALVYSRVLGTSGSSTGGNAVAVDNGGAAYITGVTGESNFPVTAGSLRTSLAGWNDAFVAKLNDAGQVVYATYLGGNQNDSGAAIAVNASGNAFVAGGTWSNNFPTTAVAFAGQLKGEENAFVAELNAAGTALVYATYLGSSSFDSATGLALDAAGNCYVVGQTAGTDFPTTPSAFATSKPGGYNGHYSTFVSKLNPTGTTLVYSTYLGGTDGNSGDTAAAVALDSNLLAYVAGTASSSDFPTTAGALQTRQSGQNSETDIFLVQVSADGGSLQYSTVLGSTSSEYGMGVALDGAGGVYVAGFSFSWNYPATPGAFQSTNPKTATGITYSNAVISKVDLNSPVMCTPTVSPVSTTVPGRGGSFSFNLTLAPGCPWEAIGDNSVTLTGATHGMGSASPITIAGTVPVNNNTGSVYTSTVQVGTATFTINQAPGSCQDPVITPLSYIFNSNGGSAGISLALPSGCSWTASSAEPWLNITAPSPANGIGAASITISAPPNDFSQRSTTLTIDNEPISITQTGSTCTATATASPTSFGGAGDTGVARIATSAGNCVWAAYSLVPWIQVAPSNASGQGAGSAPFVVAGNPGAVPRSGQILIADQTITINQSAGPAGTIASFVSSVFAGGGQRSAPSQGDGGPALEAYLIPQGLAFDPTTGNLYVVDASISRLRVITPDGNINAFAGGGLSTTDNVPPLTAMLSELSTVSVDGAGAVYVNTQGALIRRIANGNIATFAGVFPPGGTNGDNGPATSATLSNPLGTVFDALGNFYIADSGSGRIREVTGGIITTFAGGGSNDLGDGGPATSAVLAIPSDVAVDSAGNVYIADTYDSRVREVITQAGPAQGSIITVAGSGANYYEGDVGDAGPATLAALAAPIALAFDPTGNLFIGQRYRIRKVAPDGTITTVVNSVSPVVPPAGGITSDLLGNVYYSDAASFVYKLTPTSAFCTYTISPVTTQPNTAGPLSINVTAATGCNWTASSDATWATISSGSTGTANGTVQLTLTSNNTNQPRTGNINIAGQAVSITQNGNPPALTAAMMHTGSFHQGQQNAVYFVAVSNAATSMPTSAPVTVTDFAPSQLTLVSMSGTGWTCGGNICSRSDALAGGSSYPPITVIVNVASNAPSQVTNEISVVGGGSTGATAYDPTTIASISIALNVAGCFTATVQGEPTHATSWTITPQIGTLEIVPMWIGITPFAGPFDQIDIACYTPSPSGPNTITLTATSEADTGLTTSILLNGHTGQPD